MILTSQLLFSSIFPGLIAAGFFYILRLAALHKVSLVFTLTGQAQTSCGVSCFLNQALFSFQHNFLTVPPQLLF
jgi:hypothetical protein